MSLAEETRAAVRARPFLLEGLRAGIVNYAAAARAVDVAEDTDAVATALRRYADRLPGLDAEAREARVTMHGGLSPDADDPLLSVGDVDYGEDGGPLTAVLATGEVGAGTLAHVLGVLAGNGVEAEAAGAVDGSLVVVVERRDGPAAVRHVETALETAPAKTTV